MGPWTTPSTLAPRQVLHTLGEVGLVQAGLCAGPHSHFVWLGILWVQFGQLTHTEHSFPGLWFPQGGRNERLLGCCWHMSG